MKTETYFYYTIDIYTDLLEIHSYQIIAHDKDEAMRKALLRFSEYDDNGKIVKIKIHH